MAAYVYQDWRSATTLAEKVRLGYLHIAELRSQVKLDVNSDGNGVRGDTITRAIESDLVDIRRYEDQLNSIGSKSGGMSYAQITTARP